MAPGSVRGLHLVVADIDAARAELASRGVEMGAVADMGGIKFSAFKDPDGNTWTLQEMRGWKQLKERTCPGGTQHRCSTVGNVKQKSAAAEARAAVRRPRLGALSRAPHKALNVTGCETGSIGATAFYPKAQAIGPNPRWLCCEVLAETWHARRGIAARELAPGCTATASTLRSKTSKRSKLQLPGATEVGRFAP